MDSRSADGQSVTSFGYLNTRSFFLSFFLNFLLTFLLPSAQCFQDQLSQINPIKSEGWGHLLDELPLSILSRRNRDGTPP
ncbi:hypothetical protein F4824DRAFT_472689 [Ustulina deusta]|nr:hypothetical protein F4824DRAFT_472689 [Ustulina deusta]